MRSEHVFIPGKAEPDTGATRLFLRKAKIGLTQIVICAIVPTVISLGKFQFGFRPE
jgi:hypothetical protein